MNWNAIGAIGELLGAAAVFVSLVYLALQIRANTHSLEIASRQSVANEFRNWVQAFLNADPTPFTIGLSNYPNMPFIDRATFCHHMHDLLVFYQSAQAMHEAGALPDDSHEPYRAWVAAVINTPGGKNFWSEWKATYNTSVRLSIDTRLVEGNLPDPLEHPQYQLDPD
jgi:hypothetical protein